MATIKVSEKEMEKIVGKTDSTRKIVKIVGNALILTSKLKFDTLKKIEGNNNNALCLLDSDKEDAEEIFRIATGKVSSISKYGIVFGEKTADGFARATILLPEDVTDKKTFVKENFGKCIFMLKDLEDVVETIAAKLEADYAKLDEEIEEE